jgi:uracil-DNA glycosylase
MKINHCIGCETFPCLGVNQDAYILPGIDLTPEAVSAVVISEAAPENAADYYYVREGSLFQQNTVEAFKYGGVDVDSFQGLLDMGIYFTTAVKCGKIGYRIKAGPIKECSKILEAELSLFPNVKSFLLMGDVAIKAVNYIAKRTMGERAIPTGATYKIRRGEFYFRDARAFPSYLQVGPSFGIEKSKQRMIGEDIAAAMALL